MSKANATHPGDQPKAHNEANRNLHSLDDSFPRDLSPGSSSRKDNASSLDTIHEDIFMEDEPSPSLHAILEKDKPIGARTVDLSQGHSAYPAARYSSYPASRYSDIAF